MCRRSGFTLIELLVVMLVMAFLAAGVSQVVNPTGSTSKRINRQGDQVFAQMQFALDDALIRYSALGIVAEVNKTDSELVRKYSWYRYNGEEWEATDSPLGTHSLHETLTWSIEVEDASLEESLDDLLSEEEDKIKPIIVFYPSGEVSDFSVEITLSDKTLADIPEASDERYKIALNERGQLQRFQVGEFEE